MDEHETDNVLPPRQRNWVLFLSISILYLTLDLVRRRKVREDDSWVWLIVGIMTFIFGTQYGLLKRFSRFLGIVAPSSTIFFFGQFFLMLLAMQTSMRNSSTQEAIKNITQALAILRNDIQTIRASSHS